jgi:hypothetical protein
MLLPSILKRTPPVEARSANTSAILLVFEIGSVNQGRGDFGLIRIMFDVKCRAQHFSILAACADDERMFSSFTTSK